jgi:hypothetical protein
MDPAYVRPEPFSPTVTPKDATAYYQAAELERRCGRNCRLKRRCSGLAGQGKAGGRCC